MIRDFHDAPGKYEQLNNITNDSKALSVRHCRTKNSHVGISTLQQLTSLSAVSVNQDYLDEICLLKNLTSLEMEIVTAEDLSGLRKLTNLRTLRLEAVRKAIKFEFLQFMTHLEALYLEHVKHLPSLELFSDMHHLKRLGIEGSMYTKAKVETLEPFNGLKGLEGLYMTSVQLKDKKLTYLRGCSSLVYLQCARFASKKNFEALRSAMPNLECKWCDNWEI